MAKMKSKNTLTFKKSYAIFSIIGLLVVGGGTIWYYNVHQGVQVQVRETVEALTVRNAVENSQKVNGILSGEIEANNTTRLKIDTSRGEVKDIFVKEGDTVTAGQPLFSYSSSQAITAQAAGYDVQEREAAIEVARSNSYVKWDTYNRKVNALNQLRNQYDKSKDESLLAEIKTAQDEVASSLSEAQTGDNEVKTAEIAYNKAVATSQTENERLQYDTVTADTDGTVTKLNEALKNQSKEKKERENFIEVIDRSKYFVRGEVNEIDRDKIAVGQRVIIVDRKNPNKTWTGTVTQVGDLTIDGSANSDGKENPNMSKYAYKVEVDQSENAPILGTHTYVRLIDPSTEVGKLILSKDYIFERDGKTYVWKVVDNKITEQEVKGDKISDDLYDIREGLSPVDSIALLKAGMTAGMEVGQDVNAPSN